MVGAGARGLSARRRPPHAGGIHEMGLPEQLFDAPMLVGLAGLQVMNLVVVARLNATPTHEPCREFADSVRESLGTGGWSPRDEHQRGLEHLSVTDDGSFRLAREPNGPAPRLRKMSCEMEPHSLAS